MPLQNRVNPFGRLIAVSARGEFLGNRGILHNHDKVIVSPWKHKNWVTCRLSFKGRQRTLFSPNRYSELFFLDEATALAAGHRPCAQCRRERFNEFKSYLLAVNTQSLSNLLSAPQIDKQLHSERAGPKGAKITYFTAFKNIPAGSFIVHEAYAHLYWESRLLKWSHHGYCGDSELPNRDDKVEVITPYSIVQLFKQGFKPTVHASAYNQ